MSMEASPYDRRDVDIMNGPTVLRMPRHAAGVRSFDQARVLSSGVCQFEWRFAADDQAFVGHFPHQPILPGVFLLEMAQRAAEHAIRESGGGAVRLFRVERFRFFSAVLPGDSCVLNLDWKADRQSSEGSKLKPVWVAARFSKFGNKVAQGLLVMRSESSEACEVSSAS